VPAQPGDPGLPGMAHDRVFAQAGSGGLSVVT